VYNGQLGHPTTMTIVAATDLTDQAVLRAPVAVLGGGAAGVTIALRLAERGVDCVVIESGIDAYNERTQQLYDGEAPGYWDLRATRLRQFGGSTNHFAGVSRPLDAIDFEEAAWRPGTSWPIAHEALTAHLPAAVALLGLAADRWDAESWFPDSTPMKANPALDGVSQPALAHLPFQVMPGSIALRHAAALAGSDRITVVQQAHAVRVALSDDGERVAAIELVTFAGTSLTVEADAYVLAAGGIESARLLLASDDRRPAGVGNGADNVGRYFADHAELLLGVVAERPGSGWTLPGRAVDGPSGSVWIASIWGPTPETRRDSGMPGFNVRVTDSPSPIPETDTPTFAVGSLVGAGDPQAPATLGVFISLEVVPNPASRVTLSAERNELGERSARLDWRFTAEDATHMDRVVEIVAWQLAGQGLGRLPMARTSGAWLDLVSGQHHHMGTLRMSATPADGVVDADLRFHEVPNLYAAGSAVFPTYGHVNPTLNLVALSLRLADHLADRIVR
jgi:choline dehydrogenase-like flavoprotein